MVLKRPRAQFNLRHLLLAVTLLATLCAWWSARQQEARVDRWIKLDADATTKEWWRDQLVKWSANDPNQLHREANLAALKKAEDDALAARRRLESF